MGTFKFIAAIIVLVIAGSVVMLFVKQYRKRGMSILGIILLLALAGGLYTFIPRHYDRNYLTQSAEWKNLSFRSYADSVGFFIGAIPGGTELSDPAFSKNFNSVTPENALKMGPLLKDLKIGEYDFSHADKLVDEALSLNLRVRGHTLVWGKQSDMFKSPDLMTWLEQFPESERSRILKETIENHIVTVLNHFKGRIHVWDVVNEPMSVFNQGNLENNVYLKYLGEDYISGSFELAHSIDPDLKLYLNENFLNYTDKTAEAFIALLRKLKENNVPLHGVGIQGHGADTSITDLQNFIRKITDLGLEVEITELDTRLRLFNSSDDPYEAQGKYYARMLESCMSNPQCKGLTFWGFSDDRCWMDQVVFFPKPNEPYLFDGMMNPKPAYYEVYRTLKDKYEAR